MLAASESEPQFQVRVNFHTYDKDDVLRHSDMNGLASFQVRWEEDDAEGGNLTHGLHIPLSELL